MGKMVKPYWYMHIPYRTQAPHPPSRPRMVTKLPMLWWTTQEENNVFLRVIVQASAKNEIRLFANCSCVILISSKISFSAVYADGAGGWTGWPIASALP